ncbi:hypothetical protein LAWI1_G008475 [Lachnellula willkommii]|uniref:DUF7726 domain-containing protein n=1 Tax=Lachnellula willkommii TaxID=215461 RepID=A0A559LYR4_9HELO|nr:hypothetical protein LAWI1_G008475 [Lachnellula willkommii]
MASNSGSLPRQPLAAVSSNVNVAPPINSGLKKAVPTNNKRKATDEPREEIDIDDDRCRYVDISCDRVRTKIRNFLSSGEMKVGEFQKAIGTNSKSYGAFMAQSGAYKGVNSSVYSNAFAFFKHRELNGIKAPTKKIKPEDISKFDVSGIELEGEAEGEVEVYDTCDETRKKIRAHLASPSVTQAGFLREISKTYRDGRKISSSTLNTFMGKKGPLMGNTSPVFYASYVYFEKLRIRDGKPKSEFRLDMEEIYDGLMPFSGGPGVNVKDRHDGTYIVPHSVKDLYYDKYGRVHTM